MGAKISNVQFALVLRGWLDSKRRLRVVVDSRLGLSLGVFCTVDTVNDNGDFCIAVAESSFIGVSITGCTCGFLDVPAEELILGKRVDQDLSPCGATSMYQ